MSTSVFFIFFSIEIGRRNGWCCSRKKCSKKETVTFKVTVSFADLLIDRSLENEPQCGSNFTHGAHPNQFPAFLPRLV